MANRTEELRSDILRTEFHKIAGREWDSVFDKLLELLAADDPEIVDFALKRTASAIWSEKFNSGSEHGVRINKSRGRLDAVLRRLQQRRDIVDRVIGFTRHARWILDDEESRSEFLEWVGGFRPTGDAAEIWEVASLAMKVRLYAFGGDWGTASSELTSLLDHSSLLVRASAAAALGELIANRAGGPADLSGYLRQVRDKEIERPGIAGPFYDNLCRDLDELTPGGRPEIKKWMLSILEKRNAPEPPLLDYGYNGIDFHAHELFAGDMDGIRELISIGREDIAVAAATDIDEAIEGMDTALVALGNSQDPETCRRA